MKKLIAIEGKQLGPRDYRMIDRGSMYMDDEFVPVDISFNYNYVGKASNLRREGDEVYVDIEIFDKYKDQINLDDWDATSFMTLEEYHSSEEINLIVDKGRVRGVTLTMSGAHRHVE